MKKYLFVLLSIWVIFISCKQEEDAPATATLKISNNSTTSITLIEMLSWWTFDPFLSGPTIDLSDEETLDAGKSRSYPIYAPGKDSMLGSINYLVSITAGGQTYKKECKDISENSTKEFSFNGNDLLEK